MKDNLLDDLGGWSLTGANLIDIGACDDFYELFLKVRDYYEDLICEQVKLGHGHYDIDKMARKTVMEMCDPVLLKHHRLFSNREKELHATTYGFETFRMYYIKHARNQSRKYEIEIYPFKDFLHEIQYSVTRILYRRKLGEKPQYQFAPFF